jgi:hypothetical protein
VLYCPHHHCTTIPHQEAGEKTNWTPVAGQQHHMSMATIAIKPTQIIPRKRTMSGCIHNKGVLPTARHNTCQWQSITAAGEGYTGAASTSKQVRGLVLCNRLHPVYASSLHFKQNHLQQSSNQLNQTHKAVAHHLHPVWL